MEIVKFITSVLFSILFLSCEKPENKIRIRNNFKESIVSATVGDVKFYSIRSASVSEYRSLEGRKFDVSITTSSEVISGKGKINKLGNHNWTIYLNTTGAISIQEE